MTKITKYIYEGENDNFDFTYLKDNIEKVQRKEIDLSKRPKYNKIFAKYSSGENDYQRHFEICAVLDKYATMIGAYQGGLNDCLMYLSCMRTLWININAIMEQKNKEDIDQTIHNINKSLLQLREEGGDSIPINIYGALVELNEMIYYLRQRKGMGIEVTKQVTETERLKEAFQ